MRGTVVVAEDDAGLREVLLHVLHEAGYQVHLVSGETDTLAALRRLGARCLLVLEARLPDGASEAILKTLNSGPGALPCPVVLLSGPPVESRSANVVGRPAQAVRADPHAGDGTDVLSWASAPSSACPGFRARLRVMNFVSSEKETTRWLD